MTIRQRAQPRYRCLPAMTIKDDLLASQSGYDNVQRQIDVLLGLRQDLDQRDRIQPQLPATTKGKMRQLRWIINLHRSADVALSRYGYAKEAPTVFKVGRLRQMHQTRAITIQPAIRLKIGSWFDSFA